jgi:hypothetical protein
MASPSALDTSVPSVRLTQYAAGGHSRALVTARG